MGLERLLGDGWISDEAQLRALLCDQIVPRWLEFDRVYVARGHAVAADTNALTALEHDCETRNLSVALRDASLRIGRGTLTTHARRGTPGAAEWLASIADGRLKGHAPCVQGGMGAALGLGLMETEAGALHGTLAAFASAAVRLGAIGALKVQPLLADAAALAEPCLVRPAPESPHGFAPFLEIAASRSHDAATRLFAN
jgi:urease accessory protein